MNLRPFSYRLLVIDLPDPLLETDEDRGHVSIDLSAPQADEGIRGGSFSESFLHGSLEQHLVGRVVQVNLGHGPRTTLVGAYPEHLDGLVRGLVVAVGDAVPLVQEGDVVVYVPEVMLNGRDLILDGERLIDAHRIIAIED